MTALVHIYCLSSIYITLSENLCHYGGVIFFVDINVHLNVNIWQGDVQSEPLLKRHRK